MEFLELPKSIARRVRDIEAAFLGPRRSREKRAQYQQQHGLEWGLRRIAERWPQLQSESVEEPIFILSAGWRSGSTMLQRLLMAGGNYLIWGEPYSHAGIIDGIAAPIACFTDRWPHDAWFVEASSVEDLSRRWVANLYPPMDALLRAHVDLFQRLFGDPARLLGARGWGLKDARLTTGHAMYLKWLFPRAKFIFLYRNPFSAYRSYRPYRRWYVSWPEQPVFTPWAFGTYWKAMTDDFVSGYGKVDGLLLRYEDLTGPEPPLEALSRYVGFQVPPPAQIERIADSTPRNKGFGLPAIERALLQAAVAPTATRLGYRPD